MDKKALQTEHECEQLWTLIGDKRDQLSSLLDLSEDPLLQSVLRVCFLESARKKAEAAYPPDIACPTCGSLVYELLD